MQTYYGIFGYPFLTFAYIPQLPKCAKKYHFPQDYMDVCGSLKVGQQVEDVIQSHFQIKWLNVNVPRLGINNLVKYIAQIYGNASHVYHYIPLALWTVLHTYIEDKGFLPRL